MKRWWFTQLFRGGDLQCMCDVHLRNEQCRDFTVNLSRKSRDFTVNISRKSREIDCLTIAVIIRLTG